MCVLLKEIISFPDLEIFLEWTFDRGNQLKMCGCFDFGHVGWIYGGRRSLVKAKLFLVPFKASKKGKAICCVSE